MALTKLMNLGLVPKKPPLLLLLISLYPLLCHRDARELIKNIGTDGTKWEFPTNSFREERTRKDSQQLLGCFWGSGFVFDLFSLLFLFLFQPRSRATIFWLLDLYHHHWVAVCLAWDNFYLEFNTFPVV